LRHCRTQWKDKRKRIGIFEVIDSNEIAIQRINDCLISQEDYLDLSGLGLTELPQEISQLTQLKYLNLENNQLSIFPIIICNLRNLNGLYLEGNPIKDLPIEITNLDMVNDFRIDLEFDLSFEFDNLPSKIIAWIYEVEYRYKKDILQLVD